MLDPSHLKAWHALGMIEYVHARYLRMPIDLGKPSVQKDAEPFLQENQDKDEEDRIRCEKRWKAWERAYECFSQCRELAPTDWR